ncbi:uncharacterized protein At5g08430-like isoform X2 [Mangifera indica]|uniref:uncharacterized protein At5g08430-like isoform X2 n=1 Tax=Mangifera indica TaxID=29780 RepID=UPI001CFA31B4|nr:uncharacterized protein At5g08430-like isoform X2 [Mangifera indica]
MGRRKKLKKEEIAEDWCFICKDGGSLRICDYKDCLKSYHPDCVDQDDSLLESKDQWTCGWHFCYECKKAPKFYCLCCPFAVCGHCLCASGFAVVRGNKGFCESCLELVMRLEEKKDVNSNGEKIDFYGEDTIEFFFIGYWQMVKEKEGLTSEHVISADNLVKKGKNHRSPDSYEYDENEEDIEDFVDDSQLVVSDYDDLGYSAEDKKIRKRNRSKRKQSAPRRKASSKKKEFIGWGSKLLLEFLDSIGIDATRELSQDDLTTIITKYCKENQLFHPERKKIIICDARLQHLLGKKSVNRNSIYNRLTAHLAENIDHSEDESESSLDIVDECDSVVEERKQQMSSVRKSNYKEVVAEVQKSCFASVVPKNIKLVYLRRSLVEDLAKQPEAFDAKVIGSFVRVKSDPNDYLQKNSHQLVQVLGIKRTSSVKSEILLKLSNRLKELPISKLSDDDFSEDECKDLQQGVKNGLLKRPTVLELEQKARSLHEDITKHWIARELVSLQNLIDRANEKGWRRELAEYMDILQLLQTPSEQSRLLNEVPQVIADVVEPEPACEESEEKAEQELNDGLPESFAEKAPKDPSCSHTTNGKFRCLNDSANTTGMTRAEPQSFHTNEQQHKDESQNLAAGPVHACQVPIHVLLKKL